LKADDVYSLQGYKHGKISNKMRSDSNALAGSWRALFETDVQIKCVRVRKLWRVMKAWFDVEATSIV